MILACAPATLTAWLIVWQGSLLVHGFIAVTSVKLAEKWVSVIRDVIRNGTRMLPSGKISGKRDASIHRLR
jgi:hypothetical protein